MKERMQEILQAMLRRLDLVVTGVLIGLLVLAGYLILAEENYTLPQPPPPQPRQWDVKLPVPELGALPGKEVPEADNAEAYERIEKYFIETNSDIDDDETARRVVVVNMFDIRALDEGEVTARLNQLYNRAETEFEQGNLQEALSIVENILRQDPNHRQARDLRGRINTQLNDEG